ncbi:PIR Superfamily Protein [Plasmodium ovale curtisi]|uniref:PIR Superfamily Protein n=1 Tax=Plasmodium ovale curtisi TaxID=864141 RepID=A0A1A8WHA1_PLAOA|nr:PIR Superfamily Protein [Plasmodium ovale curtisi]
MAAITLSFEKFCEEDATLNDEELFNFYSKFNKVCSTESKNSNICSENNIYTGVDASVRDLYKSLIGNLKLLYEKTDNEYFRNMNQDNYKRCIYLRYWFYDQLVNKKFDNTKVKTFFKWWKESAKNIFHDCKCDFDEMKKDNIFNLKRMYDVVLLYGKNSNKLSERIKKLPDHKYCNYIKNSYIWYDLAQTTCSDETDAYCKQINNYIKNNMDVQKLTELQCNSERKAIVITEDEQKVVDWGLAINPLVPKGQNEASSGMQGSSSHIVIGIFASAFGLFLLSLILYKFTPFGPWISPRMKNYQRMWNKIIGNNYGSLLDNPESQQIESDNIRYNIAYHSERNS